VSKPPYETSRPTIPADLRRAVLIEAGHACAVTNCGDHSYLEIHHIDENRENNILENLILLCRKHHAMAHAGVIDRKSLKLYKDNFKDAELAELRRRLEQVEQAIGRAQHQIPQLEPTSDQPSAEIALKSAPRRFAVLQFTLYQVAISKLEKDLDLYFERNVEFRSGDSSLVLDGLRAKGEEADVLIEVFYIRKGYLDAPAYGAFVNQKVELYELLTGRPARAILLAVVGRESLLEPGALPLTRSGVEPFDKVSLHVYSCEQVGFLVRDGAC
jgi:hypothetical protein